MEELNGVGVEKIVEMSWVLYVLAQPRIIPFTNTSPPIHEWHMPFTNIGYFSVSLNGISHRGISKLVPSHPGMLCYSRLAYASQEYALMRAFPIGIYQSGIRVNETIPNWYILVTNRLV